MPPLSCESTAVRALCGLLHQLFELLESLGDAEYVCNPVGVIDSNIAGHVRHNLDHVEAMLLGLRTGWVCYDHRVRGTAVELDRVAAMETVLRHERELLSFPWAEVPPLLTLSALVAPDAPPVVQVTSPERELAFVTSHTIHHNALIAILAKLLGARVPPEFGYAPSTVAHRRSRPCAP